MALLAEAVNTRKLASTKTIHAPVLAAKVLSLLRQALFFINASLAFDKHL